MVNLVKNKNKNDVELNYKKIQQPPLIEPNLEKYEEVDKILQSIAQNKYGQEVNTKVASDLVKLEFLTGKSLNGEQVENLKSDLHLYYTLGDKQKVYKCLYDAVKGRDGVKQKNQEQTVVDEDNLCSSYKKYFTSLTSKQIDNFAELAKNDSRFNHKLSSVRENVTKIVCAREVLIIERFLNINILDKDAFAMYKALYNVLKNSTFQFDVKKEDCLVFAHAKYVLKQKRANDLLKGEQIDGIVQLEGQA